MLEQEYKILKMSTESRIIRKEYMELAAGPFEMSQTVVFNLQRLLAARAHWASEALSHPGGDCEKMYDDCNEKIRQLLAIP